MGLRLGVRLRLNLSMGVSLCQSRVRRGVAGIAAVAGGAVGCVGAVGWVLLESRIGGGLEGIGHGIERLGDPAGVGGERCCYWGQLGMALGIIEGMM